MFSSTFYGQPRHISLQVGIYLQVGMFLYVVVAEVMEISRFNIPSTDSSFSRAMVWVGDLNVAHTPADVTHPKFFSSQMAQPNSGDSGQAGERKNEEGSVCACANLCLQHQGLGV